MSAEFDPNNPLRLKNVRQNDEDSSEAEDFDVNTRRRKKRNVDAAGYDEDSENDAPFDSDVGSEDDKAEGKEDEAKEEDNDSDMFSDDDEEEAEAKTTKNQIKVMDMDRFEKENMIQSNQSYTKTGTTDDDESEGDGEPKVDSFDLRKEMQEGTFTSTGEYIEMHTETNQEDDELSAFKKDDIRRAKLAKEAQDERLEQQRKIKAEDPENTAERLLFNLIGMLKPVESPMEALQRVNKQQPKKKRKNNKKVELTEEEKSKEHERQISVTNITDYCESLMEQGFKNIYELEREELMLLYRQETGRAYVKPKTEDITPEEPKIWKFRWVGDSTIHGPYTSSEMGYWKDNYFQDRVEVIRTGSNEFVHISQIDSFC